MICVNSITSMLTGWSDMSIQAYCYYMMPKWPAESRLAWKMFLKQLCSQVHSYLNRR